jgi:diguanylate cyclase (GGDEF)-like protein
MSTSLEKTAETPLSLVAAQIVKEALRPEASLQVLGRLAESDPGFALRVVGAVNSAAFGVARHVTDVKSAVSLLGIRGIKNLALGLVLSDMVPVGADGEALLGNSLRRAVACRLLAEAMGERQTDDYFMSGLLLEVGLLMRARADLRGAAEIARAPSEHRCVLERALGSAEHPSAGAELVRSFGLPETVAEAVLHHHDADPANGRMPAVAWAAERIAAVWERGDLARNQAIAVAAAQRVGLTEAQVEGILKRVPTLVTAVAQAFACDVSPQAEVDTLLVDAHRSLLELNNNYETMVRRLEALIVEKEMLARQLADANEKLERLATTDELTGIANKRALMELLRRDLSRTDREASWLGLVVMDVDFFKRVNDTWGHPTGDEVLRVLAGILRCNLRTGDLAGRYGGEEFVLILPGANILGAKVVAERVRASIEATPIQGPDGPFHVTASFGVTAVRGPGCKSASEELISRADAALYVAKRNGRNRVELSVAAAVPSRRMTDAEVV